MSTHINLRQAQAWLMKMSLHDFIVEFWDSYETAPFVDCWLLEWQSECFMYSLKHFLPYYVWKDWITDEQYAKIQLETGGICPVRDKLFEGMPVRNHDWNMPPRHSKTTVLGVCGPVWAGINTPLSVATVAHNSKLSSETNEKRLKLLQSEKFRYYYKDDLSLKLAKQSATNIKLVNGAQLYSVCQTGFTGFGGDCFPAGTRIITKKGDKNIEDITPGEVVLTYDVVHQNNEWQSVEATRSVLKYDFIELTYNNHTLVCTPEHRIWVDGVGYVEANKLKIGYKVLDSIGNTHEIQHIVTRSSKKVVYDIQTSRNHNFFANGILVHNCIIADDLISADNAARDMQILRNVREFFKQTLPTRLNTKKTGVIWHIQQRLAPGDISGMIADSPELRQVYSHTELQAISTKNITLIYPCTGKVKEIKKGDCLWPERFGDYTSLKLETGPIIFETQYQQKAKNTNLTVIKEEDIHYIDNEEDYEQFKLTAETQYASHDCPVKDNESNDYHGFVAGYGRGTELLIDDAWEEHLGYIKEKQLMITLQQVTPALLQVLEDKANGAALLQDLRLDVPGLVPFNPGTNSKKQRLELASVYVNSGAVRFYKTEKTQYLIKKLLEFPFVDHDDIVDAFSQLVLYHFTQRKAGVYTNCFTFQNIIDSTNNKDNNCFYGATINADHIKVLQVSMRNNGSFVAEQEWQMRGLESFESFCTNLKNCPIIIDCSYENTLSKLVKPTSVSIIPFDDNNREGGIHSLKVGFYKKKVLVNKQCPQTINDISKLRFADSSIERGDQKIATLDEGLAGCLRCVVQYMMGSDILW